MGVRRAAAKWTVRTTELPAALDGKLALLVFDYRPPTAHWEDPGHPAQELPRPGFAPSVPGTRAPMEWLRHAACVGEDPELFFPVGSTGPYLVETAAAKRVCRRCPVMA